MGNILTPSNIWGNFKTGKLEVSEIIGEYRDGDITVTRFYLKGRKVKDGQVKIYCAMARNTKLDKMPAIFIVQDFKDGADETFATYLAKRGYATFVFDFAGDTGVRGNDTVYPKSLEHANYKVCKDNLSKVEDDVTKTCWYEWGSVARHAYRYFKSQAFVEKMGVLGVGEAATVLWQLAGTEKDIDCAVFAMNSGWSAYKNQYKFSKFAEENFSDERLKYVAGIEPQTYAAHIKCPTLIVAPTNCEKFDVDRAHDTLSRIPEEVYTAIDYSVGLTRAVGESAVLDIRIFFDKFLRQNDKIILPELMEIKGDVENGQLRIDVTPDSKELKDVCVYVAEQTVEPMLRCWNKLTNKQKNKGVYTFNYQPYAKSNMVIFFATAEYKNGFTISSAIMNKKFTEEEINVSYKDNVVYSSRIQNGIANFTSAKESGGRPTGIRLGLDNVVKENAGPMGINGANCFGGLLTFKVNADKYKPKDDAMFMLDVYVKQDSVLTVKLISNYFTNKIEYVSNVKLTGGEIWHNVKLSLGQFKTAEGMGLRDYSKIQAIEIDAQGEYLINNVLWV